MFMGAFFSSSFRAAERDPESRSASNRNRFRVESATGRRLARVFSAATFLMDARGTHV